jgi:hypothetical protein
MAELAVAYKNRGVVGFDLAGAEYDHPAKHHKHAFQLVRDNNINVTIHAGEAYGPESIAQAVHTCGAHRIGHGCRLRENGDLLHYVNDHRIPLECCPSSNVQTGAIRDLASHPLKLYYNLGLRVTVNTDNRLVTDTTVSKELWLCHTQMGLGCADIKQIILAGFKSAFLPFHVKQQYLRKVSEELKLDRRTGSLLASEAALKETVRFLISITCAPTNIHPIVDRQRGPPVRARARRPPRRSACASRARTSPPSGPRRSAAVFSRSRSFSIAHWASSRRRMRSVATAPERDWRWDYARIRAWPRRERSAR